MGQNIVEKIISKHLVRGNMKPLEKISIKIDQTLTQDATGTMAYLELESLGIDRVKTELSVSYVDHNTLQTGFENADDHKFLQGVADKYGIYFSRVGNGICHQVHLERFSHPGKTLLGSDSHTPTAGGAGMLAIGAGGLDVSCAMAGIPFSILMPEVIEVRLLNRLKNGTSAKDIILEVLRILSVKGGVNKVIEYTGDGVKTLSVPERATITNMGAELGSTSSIFPSDEVTKEYFRMQDRLDDFEEILPDVDAKYSKTIVIDLSTLTPKIAMPFSPDNVVSVDELVGKKVDQVLIGSCTNSSYQDMIKVASILKGKKVHKDVSLGIAPGSRQVLSMLSEAGLLTVFIDAGARILESTCGACIGMGQAPRTNAVSLRTFNRNFYGRSGTNQAETYLVSPEVAALSAINGVISNPSLEDLNKFNMPNNFKIDDSMIIKPTFQDSIVRGPNIAPLPIFSKLENNYHKKVIIKLGDNITTDHIIMGGSKVLPFRSNIEKISDFLFVPVIPDFKKRAKENSGGVIVAGENYGQGSSREHAAIAPRYVGIIAVFAKSFARIHRQNLINNGIIPFIFANKTDYSLINEFDNVIINDLDKLHSRKETTVLFNNNKITFTNDLSEEEIEIINYGGLLNYLREKR